MSAIIPLSLNSVNGTEQQFNVNLEYTTAAVTESYRFNMDLVFDYFNAGTTTLGDMQTTIQNLQNLAVGGLSGPIDPNDPGGPQKQFYMTQMMGESFRSLLASLREAENLEPDDPLVLTTTGLANWRTNPQTRSILDFAVNSVEANRSLQALIELDYVRTGNEVLGDTLDSLEGAISLSKNVLATLQEVQALANSFDAVARQPDEFPGYIGRSVYEDEGSAYFASAIPIAITNDPAEQQTQYNQLIDLKQRVSGQITQLGTFGVDVNDPTSLASKLEAVRNQMSASLTQVTAVETPVGSGAGAGGGSGGFLLITAIDISGVLNHWIIDHQNDADTSQAGKVQQNITFAIQAGESLNDEQKEDVRRFLFVFEEYYKSAAAILNKINQIIEKMAQGIGR